MLNRKNICQLKSLSRILKVRWIQGWLICSPPPTEDSGAFSATILDKLDSTWGHVLAKAAPAFACRHNGIQQEEEHFLPAARFISEDTFPKSPTAGFLSRIIDQKRVSVVPKTVPKQEERETSLISLGRRDSPWRTGRRPSSPDWYGRSAECGCNYLLGSKERGRWPWGRQPSSTRTNFSGRGHPFLANGCLLESWKRNKEVF